MKDKIRIGVSGCLLGEKIRWDGDHKQDSYVRDILGKYFEYVSVCPEVEAGMGVPREPVALYGSPEKLRMIGKKTRRDWTPGMRRYIKARVRQLGSNDLCGFIFKSKSPSCGLGKVPVYSEEKPGKARRGAGMFADAFVRAFPLVPAEDEERLNEPAIRENFIVRVFSFYRLKNAFFIKRANPGALARFHARHRFLLLAHSGKHCQALEKIAANAKEKSWNRILGSYVSTFMEALTFKSTSAKNRDALMRMTGVFKKSLPAKDKRDILEVIEDYRRGRVPLSAPVALIRHYVKKYDVDYLRDQVYLNPHPKELSLGNRI